MFRLGIFEVQLTTIIISIKVTRSPCKLPTDVQKVFSFCWKSTYRAYVILTRSKLSSGQSLITIVMLSCSLSKALEALQVCLGQVRFTLHFITRILIHYPR